MPPASPASTSRPDSVSRPDSLPASLHADSRITRIVLVFCSDLDKDPVSAHVLEHVLQCVPFEETTIVFDGLPVLEYRHHTIHYHLVRLKDVLSHHYARYAAPMNAHFTGADAMILVNWHQGAKAPNAIFTVQTTGDMASGHFSPVDPAICRRLFLAVEEARQQAGLDTFSTWMEATHWSGAEDGGSPLVEAQNDTGQEAHISNDASETTYRAAPVQADRLPTAGSVSPPASINDLCISVIDLEIGSCPEDWANPTAAAVLARALFRVADPQAVAVGRDVLSTNASEAASETAVRTQSGDASEVANGPPSGHAIGSPIVSGSTAALLPVLCIGGTHFEPAFTQLLRDHGATQGLALSHILPNHWLVAYGYDGVERDEALAACAASIVGGVRAVIFHDNLKGSFKARVRQLADALGVPALSHKKLRTPDIAKVIRDAQMSKSP